MKWIFSIQEKAENETLKIFYVIYRQFKCIVDGLQLHGA